MRALNVYIIIGEATRTGIWCHDCALPSMIHYPTHALTETGVSSGTGILYCPGCKERAENKGAL